MSLRRKRHRRTFAVPVPPRVRHLAAYLLPEEERAGKLRLDFNENVVGCPPSVLRAIRGMSAEQVAMYPEYGLARAKLAQYLGVRPAELLLTNGADGAIGRIVQTFVQPGDAVLLVEPTFPMYGFYAQLAGARVKALRYTAQAAEGKAPARRRPLRRLLHFPLRQVLRELAKSPRVFFLANPNNPTGTLQGRAEMRQMLEAAQYTLVVVDEAYFEFCGLTVVPWIHRYPNLVVLRTFSKAAGLAGLRLGCLVAGPEAIHWLRRTQDPFPVNAAALAAAVAAARDGQAIRCYASQIRTSREILVRALEQRGVATVPSAANFILADFGPRAPALVAELAKRGILLRDRSADFGRPGYVRVTIGLPAHTRRLLRELDRIL
jgi:histidinol-phosphate aminotransferase